MRSTTRRRSISLTFPAGFVELTTHVEPRHSFWERQLTAAYPDLDRATRSEVLSHLESTNLIDRLGGLGAHLRVALGLVMDGPDLKGVVLLTVTAVQTEAGWSAGDLEKGLRVAAQSRMGMRVSPLRCPGAVALLVEREEPFTTRHDVYLADKALDAVMIVSAFVESTAPVDVLPTLTELVASYR